MKFGQKDAGLFLSGEITQGFLNLPGLTVYDLIARGDFDNIRPASPAGQLGDAAIAILVSHNLTLLENCAGAN
jgi:hypothetical protein